MRPGWRDRPHAARLPPDRPDREAILERHRAACAHDEPTYIDPATGATVMTAVHLAEQGACCEQGCRHCPWFGAG